MFFKCLVVLCSLILIKSIRCASNLETECPGNFQTILEKYEFSEKFIGLMENHVRDYSQKKTEATSYNVEYNGIWQNAHHYYNEEFNLNGIDTVTQSGEYGYMKGNTIHFKNNLNGVFEFFTPIYPNGTKFLFELPVSNLVEPIPHEKVDKFNKNTQEYLHNLQGVRQMVFELRHKIDQPLKTINYHRINGLPTEKLSFDGFKYEIIAPNEGHIYFRCQNAQGDESDERFVFTNESLTKDYEKTGRGWQTGWGFIRFPSLANTLIDNTQ